MKLSCFVVYCLSFVLARPYTPTITKEAALANHWDLITVYDASGIPQEMWRDTKGRLYRESNDPVPTIHHQEKPSGTVHYDLIQVTDGGSQITSWMYKGPDGKLYHEKPADAEP